MHHRLVSEIMSAPVITIDPDALAVDAAELMENNNVRRIIVVDQDGYMCGIVTDADVLEAKTAESMISPYDPAYDEKWLTVRDVMTAEVITIMPEAIHRRTGGEADADQDRRRSRGPARRPTQRTAPGHRRRDGNGYISSDHRSAARRRGVGLGMSRLRLFPLRLRRQRLPLLRCVHIGQPVARRFDCHDVGAVLLQ